MTVDGGWRHLLRELCMREQALAGWDCGTLIPKFSKILGVCFIYLYFVNTYIKMAVFRHYKSSNFVSGDTFYKFPDAVYLPSTAVYRESTALGALAAGWRHLTPVAGSVAYH